MALSIEIIGSITSDPYPSGGIQDTQGTLDTLFCEDDPTHPRRIITPPKPGM